MEKDYDATKSLMDKLSSLSDWLEYAPAEDKDEEFYLDWIQTQIEEMKELSTFFLNKLKMEDYKKLK